MRPLAATASGIYHGGFGRAAVDDKCAAATSGSVGKRETDQIHILAEVVAITESEGARGGGALSEDDNETGEGNGENQSDVGPIHVGQAKPGKAARNGA